MRVYIATKLSNATEHGQLARALEANGVGVTYDWTVHGSVQASPSRFAEVAGLELGGVRAADALVLILPGGSGSHVELGAAMAWNIPVIIVGSEEAKRWGADYPSVFWHHPQVHKRIEARPGWEQRVVEALRDVRHGERRAS